jgi:hypothetical protein
LNQRWASKLNLKFMTCLSISTFIYIFMSVNNFNISAIVKKYSP